MKGCDENPLPNGSGLSISVARAFDRDYSIVKQYIGSLHCLIDDDERLNIIDICIGRSWHEYLNLQYLSVSFMMESKQYYSAAMPLPEKRIQSPPVRLTAPALEDVEFKEVHLIWLHPLSRRSSTMPYVSQSKNVAFCKNVMHLWMQKLVKN